MNNETTTTVPTLAPTFEVEPQYLGPIRGFGLFLMFCVVVFIVFCGIWVHRHRDLRIVLAHQPIFLHTINIGLLIWSLSIIPLSVDDEIASTRRCDMACNANLWLRDMGFTVSFAALFSKLWRVNKLFHNPSFRRIQVEPKDVMLPFLILFSVNFALLLTMTLVDPPQWVREVSDNDPTQSFGSCKTDTVGEVLSSGVGLVNFVALVMAIYQACRARHIPEEFSESKYLAIGLYNWLQLVIVGIPIFALIDERDVSTEYYINVALLLAQITSMLCALFVPMFLHHRRMVRQGNNNGGNVRITGISTTTTTSPTTPTTPRDTQVSSTTTAEPIQANNDNNHEHHPENNVAENNSMHTKLNALEGVVVDLKQENVDLKEENKSLLEQLEQQHRDDNNGIAANDNGVNGDEENANKT